MFPPPPQFPYVSAIPSLSLCFCHPLIILMFPPPPQFPYVSAIPSTSLCFCHPLIILMFPPPLQYPYILLFPTPPAPHPHAESGGQPVNRERSGERRAAGAEGIRQAVFRGAGRRSTCPRHLMRKPLLTNLVTGSRLASAQRSAPSA